MSTPEDVLKFWFEELTPKHWYVKSSDLDAEIATRFLQTLGSIVAGETNSWRDTDEGRLAEIIVLDQFSRNIFRDSPKAFAQDSLALALAQEAVRAKADQQLSDQQRPFIYMPYMHSESLLVHDVAMQLFVGLPNLSFEARHREIIEQFGRYPHRNKVLGRESTAEELVWMESNSGF
jgi:uncharacterized protein (DUF924 family)